MKPETAEKLRALAKLLEEHANQLRLGPVGMEEGDVCNRNGCEGTLKYPPVKNCTCFISPPCSQCTDNALTCTECGWEMERA